jgi:type I restriction enzyme S subunit
VDTKTFLDNFGTIADAPGGITQLRSLILGCAFRGELISGDIAKWKSTTLGSLGKMVRGITYAKADSSKEILNGYVPLLGAANIQVEINFDGLTYVPAALIKPTQYLVDGDVLICMSSGSKHLVGKTGSVLKPFESSFGAFCAVFRIEDQTQRDYIALFFKSPFYRAAISAASRGIGINNLRVSDVESIEIVLPSPKEQTLIVAKVDELMALCDELERKKKLRDDLRTAVRASAIDAISSASTSEELNTAWKRIHENWITIADSPESIASLRSLILDLAVRGNIDAASIADSESLISWDNAQLKLDENKLWALPTALDEAKSGWSRIPLARLGQWGSGGTPTASRKEFYINGTIPWAVIGDMNNSVMVRTESSITKKALESSSTKMIPVGAVLIAMYGASIGKTAMTGIECCTNQAIAHCIVDEEVVLSEYLFLIARSLKTHLIGVGKGAAQPNISQSVLKHLLVDIPPILVQRKIVAKVDELMALCDELEKSLKERESIARKLAGSMASGIAEVAA